MCFQIRGFHILWHLAKDMGIMRYICKFCGFAHDRSQSVQTHGKKEHGADDVVLDKIKVHTFYLIDAAESLGIRGGSERYVREVLWLYVFLFPRQ